MGIFGINSRARGRSNPLVGESSLEIKMPSQIKTSHVADAYKQGPHLGQPTEKKLCRTWLLPLMQAELEGYPPSISSLPLLLGSLE